MIKRLIAGAGVVLLASAPGMARAQTSAGQVVGFGGLTFDGVTLDRALGGGIGVSLNDHVQIVGEAGHLNNVLPSPLGLVPFALDRVLGDSPVDFRLSAFYGEGGVRVLSSSRPAIRGYVEATAGVARLRSRLSVANPIVDGVANLALQAFDSTDPLIGLGGGVLIQGGPLVLDLGYRYKRIFANDSLAGVLTPGSGLNVNQIRAGFGVRF